MKKTLTAAVFLLSNQAVAQEDIEIFCDFDDGRTTSSVEVNVSPEGGFLSWGRDDNRYEITYFDDDFILGNKTGSGASVYAVMIHRPTGRFWLSLMGNVCSDAECVASLPYGEIAQGECFRRAF
ncbi:hypothetical protein [Roseicyclus marinus]|uniref:hypothetical protein n=1 Tax=Roseicyclus marinus TaxID=2161673 RepID=UPI00240FE7B9|nr:hypothetical protein [Roseicyclus marinus]MDG3039860.1 hypothetical protein [Roseicyclus marinus]